MDSKKRRTRSSARKKPPLKVLEQKDKEQEAQAAAKLTGENSDKTEASPNRAENSSPEPNCSICLGHLQNKSFTDSCFHMFCFVCIQEWSKVKAECPLCKQKFTSIIHNVRSYEDYDQYPIPQKNPAWEETESRNFRYRTTLTFERSLMIGPGYVPRQHQEHDYTLQRPTQAVTTRSNWRQRRQRATTDFRRRIYINGLRVTDTKNRRLRTRMVTPEFFRRNDACTHRLVPWLNRELNALLFNHHEHVQFVLELILGMIKNYPISSEEFYQHVYPYLGRHTRHFMHEFENFAKSPFNMAAYDQHAVYQPHAVTVESDSEVESISSDENWGNDDDVILISPTQDRPSEPSEPRISMPTTTSDSTMNYVQNRADEERMTYEDLSPLLTRVRNFLSADMLTNHGTSTSGWDSPTPGPSWLIDSEVPAAEQSAVEQHIPQELKTPSAVKTETVTTSKSRTSCSDSSSDSYSDSSDGSDLMIVSYEKPWQERSPIVLSSDSDDTIIPDEQQKSKHCKKLIFKSGHRDRRRDRSHSRHHEDYSKRHRSHDHGQSHSRRYRSRSRSRSLSRRDKRHDRRHERSRSRHRSRGSYRSNSRDGRRSRHRSPSFSRDRSRSSTSSNHRHHSSSHQRKRHRSRSESIEIVDYQQSKYRRKEKKMRHKKRKHKKHKKHTRHSSSRNTQAHERQSGHQVRSQVVVVDKPELEKVTSESDNEEVLIDVVYCSDTNEQKSSKICTTDVEKSVDTNKTSCSETENVPLADNNVENQIQQKLVTLDRELPKSDIHDSESSAVASESSKLYKKHPSGHKKSSSKISDILNSLSHKDIDVSSKRTGDKEFKKGDKNPSRKIDTSISNAEENNLSGNVDTSISKKGVNNPSGNEDTSVSKEGVNNPSGNVDTSVSREGVNNPSGNEDSSVSKSEENNMSGNVDTSISKEGVNNPSGNVDTSVSREGVSNPSGKEDTSVNTSLLTSSISESCKSIVNVRNTSGINVDSTSVVTDNDVKSSTSSSDELNTYNSSGKLSTSGKHESFALSANIVGENSTNKMDPMSDDSNQHDNGSSLDLSVSNNDKIPNCDMPSTSFSNEAVSRGNSKDSIDYLEILGEDEKDSDVCITSSSSTFFHNTALSSKNSTNNVKEMHKALDWYRGNLAACLASSRQKSVTNDEVRVDVHSDSDTDDAVDTEIRRSLFPSLEHLSRHFMQPYSFKPSKRYSDKGQKQSPIEIEESSSSDNSDVDVGDNSSFVLPGASHNGNAASLRSCVKSSQSPYAMSPGSTRTHPVILHSDADNSSDSDDCTVMGHTDSPAKFDDDCSVTGHTNSRARFDDDCTVTGHTDSPAKCNEDCSVTGHTNSPARFDDDCAVSGHTDSLARFNDDSAITGHTDSPAKFDDDSAVTGHTDSPAKFDDDSAVTGLTDSLAKFDDCDITGHTDSPAKFDDNSAVAGHTDSPATFEYNRDIAGHTDSPAKFDDDCEITGHTDSAAKFDDNCDVTGFPAKFDDDCDITGHTDSLEILNDNIAVTGHTELPAKFEDDSSITYHTDNLARHGEDCAGHLDSSARFGEILTKNSNDFSTNFDTKLESVNVKKVNTMTAPQNSIENHESISTHKWCDKSVMEGQPETSVSVTDSKFKDDTVIPLLTRNNHSCSAVDGENGSYECGTRVKYLDKCSRNLTDVLHSCLENDNSGKNIIGPRINVPSTNSQLQENMQAAKPEKNVDSGDIMSRTGGNSLKQNHLNVMQCDDENKMLESSKTLKNLNTGENMCKRVLQHITVPDLCRENETLMFESSLQNQPCQSLSDNLEKCTYLPSQIYATHRRAENQTDSIHTCSQNQTDSTLVYSQNETDSIHTCSQNQTEFVKSTNTGSQIQTDSIHASSQNQTDSMHTSSQNQTDSMHTYSQNKTEFVESTNTDSQNQTDSIHTCSQNLTEFVESTNTASQNQTDSIHTCSQNRQNL